MCDALAFIKESEIGMKEIENVGKIIDVEIKFLEKVQDIHKKYYLPVEYYMTDIKVLVEEKEEGLEDHLRELLASMRELLGGVF